MLKPLKGKPLTFWHVGGDIIWRGAHESGTAQPQPIDRTMAESMRELFQADVSACWSAGDYEAAKHATQLWVQLTRAIDAQDTWFRVIGAPAYGRAA